MHACKRNYFELASKAVERKLRQPLFGKCGTEDEAKQFGRNSSEAAKSIRVDDGRNQDVPKVGS